MITKIDRVLDQITMYRLVLYVLLGLLGLATILSSFQLLPFSPFSLLASTLFLAIMCWAANTVLARVFVVPPRQVFLALAIICCWMAAGTSSEMVRACEDVLKSLHIKHDRIKKDFFPGLV